MRSCALALVDSAAIDTVIDRAQSFADAMAALDHVLSPGSIIEAAMVLPAANRLPS